MSKTFEQKKCYFFKIFKKFIQNCNKHGRISVYDICLTFITLIFNFDPLLHLANELYPDKNFHIGPW